MLDSLWAGPMVAAMDVTVVDAMAVQLVDSKVVVMVVN